MLFKDKKIAIIGGGLVGSLLSIYLANKGAKVLNLLELFT